MNKIYTCILLCQHETQPRSGDGIDQKVNYVQGPLFLNSTILNLKYYVNNKILNTLNMEWIMIETYL